MLVEEGHIIQSGALLGEVNLSKNHENQVKNKHNNAQYAADDPDGSGTTIEVDELQVGCPNYCEEAKSNNPI